MCQDPAIQMIDRSALPCSRLIVSTPTGDHEEVRMLIVMSHKAMQEQLDAVVKGGEAMGLRSAPIYDGEHF